MSEAETTFDFPDGSQMAVLERPNGPDDPLVMEFRMVDGCAAPPPHTHPYTAETYEVTEGELEVLVGREWRKLGVGESATVPAGVRHTFRNTSGGRTVARNIHDPHHDFETYIRRIAEIAKDLNDFEKPGLGAATKMAMLWREHDDLIRPSDPPLKLGMAALNRAGRIAGVSLPPR